MDNQFYTKEQLVQSLADLYDNPNVEKSAAGGIFIFKYGKYVVDKYTPTELMREAHLLNSNVEERYAAELNGAFLMYRYFQNNPTEFNVSCGLSIQNISELFAAYLKNEGKSEATIDRYVKQVPNNSEVQNIVQSIAGTIVLFDVMDVAKLLQISQKVAAQDFDQKGGNMYSAGINAYTHFISNYCLFVKHIAKGNKKTTVQNSNQANQFPLQRILYGAPGTGKSHKIDEQTNDDNSIRTTFHPDTDYATFVGAYKPMMDTVDEYALDATGETHKIDYPNGKSSIIYKYEPQVFLKAYVEAWKRYLNKQEGEDDSYYLVIEEINRGNCAQIFGDLFQLLDREDNGYSSYAISPESSITKYLAKEAQSTDGTKYSDLEFREVTKDNGKIIATIDELKKGQKLVLPPNLHIWATMNTSDQSLFPIDSAFKRRWDWKYVPIDTKKENWTIKTSAKEYSWSSFLEKINEEIDATTHSEDKMLGFYFCRANNNVIDADKFVSKVLFYIYNDVFKDYGFDREMFKDEDGKVISFKSYYKADGFVDESKVERFLDNLKVEGADITSSNLDIETDTEGAGKAEHKETLVAVTINGERLTADDSTQFDLYLNAIKKIGVDTIGPALEAMKYRRKGSPMATKTQVQSLLDSEGYSYVEADGYYFVKGAKGYTLTRILEDLNERLNLNIQIEYR